LAFLLRRGIAPKKKKGKRKKAVDMTKTANQKGKGPANALDDHFPR
jgi:hypothetical protein